MPIEFWWWVRPLCYTGYVTLLVLGVTAIVIDKAKPGSILSCVLGVLALAPWAISIVSSLVWVLLNILILIWR